MAENGVDEQVGEEELKRHRDCIVKSLERKKRERGEEMSHVSTIVGHFTGLECAILGTVTQIKSHPTRQCGIVYVSALLSFVVAVVAIAGALLRFRKIYKMDKVIDQKESRRVKFFFLLF